MQHNTIKVTTWNLLAPIWAHPSYYPERSVPFLDKVDRLRTIGEHMSKIDSDVLLLDPGAMSPRAPSMRPGTFQAPQPTPFLYN